MINILSGIVFIAVLLLAVHIWVKRNSWYDVETGTWAPKCPLCKGKRDKYCPKSCLGDEL